MASDGRRRRAGNRSGETAQLVLFKKRGGKRRGAGRPPKGKRAGERHKARPFLHARYPVHVVQRAVAAVGNLRRRRVYQAIREATLTTARREDFRIVHLSLQRTHVHLIVEASDKTALAAGMQGFQVSAAKHLNAAISSDRPGPRRRGSVFPDRYHAEIITTPTQARHTLSYVMNNWRKHGEDRVEPMSAWTIDWFSSAAQFPAGRSTGTSRSCGAVHRRTIRWLFTNRGRGCSARAGRRQGRSRSARCRRRGLDGGGFGVERRGGAAAGANAETVVSGSAGWRAADRPRAPACRRR